MPSLLLAGVAPKWLDTASAKGVEINPLMTGPNIGAQAKQMMGDLQAMPDITFKTHQFDPDDDANLETFMTLLKSQKFDGISLGGGVRTIPQLTDYFVNLVNVTIKEQPQATLLFPLTPSEIIPQLKKYNLA